MKVEQIVETLGKEEKVDKEVVAEAKSRILKSEQELGG